MLDADRFVDVPWGHLPRADARRDCLGPGARLLIGDERHRRHRVRAVARLAFALEDRCDVARERRRARPVGGARSVRQDPQCSDRQQHSHLAHRTSIRPVVYARRERSCTANKQISTAVGEPLMTSGISAARDRRYRAPGSAARGRCQESARAAHREWCPPRASRAWGSPGRPCRRRSRASSP